MMRITCPHCGRTSSTSKTIPQGATARVKCPGCGQVFRINEQGLEVMDAPTTKAVSTSRLCQEGESG
jgi:transcription elongation factor Elf1